MSEEQLKELQEYNLEYLEAQASEEMFGGDFTSAVELKQAKREIERLKKENEYLSKKHEKIIHNIMEFVDKNTFNHRNTGERILTLHGKGILDLLDICLGSDKE